MNDMNFCHKLYDDIVKLYSDTSLYRITTYEDNLYKLKIEYIPVGFSEHIDNIKALGNISSYARFGLKNHLCKINAEVYTKESGESSLGLYFYSDLKTVCYNLSNDKWYLENGNVKKKIIIFSKNDVYSKSNTNYRLYPTSFKDLKIFPKELISVLLPYFTESYIWKDFINDNFFPPVRFNELDLYYNKKDYLEKTFKLNLPKSINKLPLKQSYALCCAVKYIKPEQQQQIFSLKFDFDKSYNIDKRKRKSIAALYLKSLLSARLKEIDKSIVNDYIDFSLQQRRPVDILAGKRKIIALHNELAKEIIRKANGRCKIIIPDTPLKYLKLPEEFTLLATQKALTDEGNINYNCVGGYGKKIASGKCVVYSANVQGERLTIEIRCRKAKKRYKFYVSQCYKAYNQPCSEDVLAYVNSCLENCSEKAIDRYLKTVTEEKRMTKSE